MRGILLATEDAESAERKAGSSNCAGDAEGGAVFCGGVVGGGVDCESVVAVIPSDFARVSKELDFVDFADAEGVVLRK